MIRLTEILNVNFTKINWTKQSENDKAIIYNIMINGRIGGRILYDKERNNYIATSQNSEAFFEPKQFKSKRDAVNYLHSYSIFGSPVGNSGEGSYQSYRT